MIKADKIVQRLKETPTKRVRSQCGELWYSDTRWGSKCKQKHVSFCSSEMQFGIYSNCSGQPIEDSSQISYMF